MTVGSVRHHCGMEIVDERTHRVLAYIDALNRHGDRPDPYYVNEFAENPDQATRQDYADLSYLARSTLRHQDLRRNLIAFAPFAQAEEGFCDYLDRLGWITGLNAARIELTSTGRALVRALNAPAIEETSADLIEVVLSPDNPFAYTQALRALSSVPTSMLVDPYFRAEELMDVADFDNVERVLVGPQLKARELAVLAQGLAVVNNSRPMEIRVASSLHDRYMIPREGKALMLGMSVGGIGKKVGTLTTLGEVATHALREAHEKIWGESKILEPAAPKPRGDLVGTPTIAASAEVTRASDSTREKSAAKKPSKQPAAKKSSAKKSTTNRATRKK